ncbi:MAG TPA: hypothetical protein DCM87_13815 [Planctomycetes bacterium]|nr:hypothetical protein [Planctomycetota bacterium]
MKLDRIVAIVLGVLLVAGFLWSQRVRPPHSQIARAAGAPLPVRRARVETAEIPIITEAVGTVRSRRQSDVASRVMAQVKETRAAAGDAVAEGAVLMVLDDRDLAARKAQAEAALAAQRQQRDEAARELERTRKLAAQDAATAQELDILTFRFAAAEAAALAAEKALEDATVQAEHAIVRAPFAGVVIEKRVDPGDLAAPGAPLITLYDPRELRLEAAVEERIAGAVKTGDALKVRIDALGAELDGRVSEVVPAVDPATRTGLVKIDLPETPGLRPGMFGRARIARGTRAAVAVPRDALVRRGQLELVFWLPEGGDRARMAIVRGGGLLPDGERVEILSGLEAGRQIIVPGPGAGALREGAQVAPQEK